MDLVIFDCDGVLVDSERITNAVFSRRLGEIGLVLTLEQMFERFLGRTMADCVAIIEAELGRPVPDDFVEGYRAESRALLAREVRPVRGVVDALAALSVPYCVASSGDPEKMRTTLSATGLLPLFEGRRFSAVDVARGKPAPDIFLHAAQRMGARPERCVVVEDTPVGTRAGVAAGMLVLGYAELMSAARLREAGAWRTFDDMDALAGLLDAAGDVVTRGARAAEAAP
jgi:HAD superfamily hydrolase (TIGR01509 family)